MAFEAQKCMKLLDKNIISFYSHEEGESHKKIPSNEIIRGKVKCLDLDLVGVVPWYLSLVWRYLSKC
jgi:hypothetical protein